MRRIRPLLTALCLSAFLCSPVFAADGIFSFFKSEPASQETVFKGNVKSRKYHHPECEHYDCKACTKKFKGRKEAEDAGFKPCKVCAGYYAD